MYIGIETVRQTRMRQLLLRVLQAAKDRKGTTFEPAVNLCARIALYARCVACARTGVHCYR